MSNQLRKVNLMHNEESENNQKIMPSNDVKSYEEDKAKTIAYLNNVAALLQKHNEQIAPIVKSYKERTGQI